MKLSVSSTHFSSSLVNYKEGNPSEQTAKVLKTLGGISRCQRFIFESVAWILCGLLHRGWLVLTRLVAGAPGGETASLKEQPDGVSLFCGVSHSHVG